MNLIIFLPLNVTDEIIHDIVDIYLIKFLNLYFWRLFQANLVIVDKF